MIPDSYWRSHRSHVVRVVAMGVLLHGGQLLAQASSSPRFEVAPVQFRPCGEAAYPKDALCTSVSVPENYDAPSGHHRRSSEGDIFRRALAAHVDLHGHRFTDLWDRISATNQSATAAAYEKALGTRQDASEFRKASEALGPDPFVHWRYIYKRHGSNLDVQLLHRITHRRTRGQCVRHSQAAIGTIRVILLTA